MRYIRTLVVSLLMLLAVFLVEYFNRVEDKQLKQPLCAFPTQLGEWTGTASRFEPEIYGVLGVDDSFLCSYKGRSGRTVQLYVGYYRSQREGRIIHSPKNCMPGAGWNIVETSMEEVGIPVGNPSKIVATRLILQKGTAKEVALYWYQSRGRSVASEFRDRMYLVLDAFRLHRTDGAFVRLLSPAIDGDKEVAIRHMEEFVQQLVPVLQEFLPS